MPAGWIRSFGPLQYRWPFATLVRFVGRNVLASRGTIRYGVGAGLRFDATGGAPGNLFGTSAPEEQATLARFLKPGQVLYDIGSNVGFFSVLGARLVGPTGRVYAFEPFPTTAAQVRINAELNGFSHLETIEAAVSNASGRARLADGGSSMQHSLKYQGPGIDVRTVAIDDLVAAGSIRPPNFVKLDVEGAEVDVLKGMHGVIARHRPVIMCEVHWIGAEFLAHVDRNLKPLGYTAVPLGISAFPTTPERFHALLKPAGR